MATTPTFRQEFLCDQCGAAAMFGFSYHAWCSRHYYYAQIIGLLARLTQMGEDDEQSTTEVR